MSSSRREIVSLPDDRRRQKILAPHLEDHARANFATLWVLYQAERCLLAVGGLDAAQEQDLLPLHREYLSGECI